MHAQLDKDVPEALAAAIVQAGLGLRKLEPVESVLEGNFLKLTGGKSS